MAISRRVARPMLSAVFIVGGLDAMRNPEGKLHVAEPVAEPLTRHVPGLPKDTETLVRLNGAVMLGSATLLALGKFRRLAALALIGSIVPTTYAGHRFWEETDEATRAEQRIHFLKNLGLLGGLLLAAMDTEGEPSLGWRVKRRVAPARRIVASTPARTAHKVDRVIGDAEDVGVAVSATADQLVKQVKRTARTLQRSKNARAKQARKALHRANLQGPTASLVEAERVAGRAAKRGKAAAVPALSIGAQRAGEVWANVADYLPVASF
jgi:putative oxidoreductase